MAGSTSRHMLTQFFWGFRRSHSDIPGEACDSRSEERNCKLRRHVSTILVGEAENNNSGFRLTHSRTAGMAGARVWGLGWGLGVCMA